MEKYNESSNDDYLLQTNLLGAVSEEELEIAEAFAFSVRASQIEQGIFSWSSFRKEDFQALHHHLFQDIYPFAGQFRNVQLAKGMTRFCQVEYLDSYADHLFSELASEPDWLTLEQAAARLAYFKSELNMLHPFREGNGRTTRIFIHSFAASKRIHWAYETLNQEEYMRAMIASVTDTQLLESLFTRTIEFLPPSV